MEKERMHQMLNDVFRTIQAGRRKALRICGIIVPRIWAGAQLSADTVVRRTRSRLLSRLTRP